MAGSTLLILTALVNALLSGFLLALPGALRPVLADGRGRAVRRLTPVLLVPLMLVSGLVIDKWGVQAALALGSVLAALALVALERGSSWTWSGAAAVLLAGAIALLATGTLVVLPHALFAGHAARAVNLGYLVIPAAALVTPPAVRLLLQRIGDHKALLGLAMLCLVPAACAAVTPVEDFGRPLAAFSWSHLLGDARMELVLLAVALCAPLEASLGPWVRRYCAERGQVPGTAALAWTGFWLAFLGTRLATALLLPENCEAWLILVLGMLAAITLGNLLGAYGQGSNMLGLWLAGACCGPLVPTLLGLALQSFPAEAGRVAALVSTAGALSNLALLPWIDASRPGRSTRTAMRAATALAVVLFAPALVLVLMG